MLLRTIVATVALCAPISVQAATLFETLEGHFEAGITLNTRDVQANQSWAGKCALFDAPNQQVAGLFDTYLVGDPNDPVMPQTLYFTMNRYSDQPADFFLRMSKEEVEVYHANHSRNLHEWRPVSVTQDPLNPDVVFSWRREAPRTTYGINYAIRRAVSANGQEFYVLKGMCPFTRCNDVLRHGDPYAYCYVWDQKL